MANNDEYNDEYLCRDFFVGFNFWSRLSFQISEFRVHWCDASEKGLGAAVLQKGQPVAFASRALTDTETRYAQIEKEMLSVVFALHKFDQYAYGRRVTIENDHKPLEAIVQNHSIMHSNVSRVCC